VLSFGLRIRHKHHCVPWDKQDRVLPIPEGKDKSDAIMHRSVYERFDLSEVLQHDCRVPYRPETLKTHIDFFEGYEKDGRPRPRPYRNRSAVAVDTEKHFDELNAGRTLRLVETP
jgi:hypothetical protein